jgi:hypothetical protein
MRADKVLEHAAELYRQRQAEYGDSYNHTGWVLDTLFSDGITLNGNQDFARFAVLVMQVTKMCRYVQNWSQPHGDSMFDNSVYSAIMNEIDDHDPRKNVPASGLDAPPPEDSEADRDAKYKASLEQSNERANPAPQFLQRRAEDRNPWLGVGDRRDAIDGRNASKIPMSPEARDKLLNPAVKSAEDSAINFSPPSGPLHVGDPGEDI